MSIIYRAKSSPKSVKFFVAPNNGKKVFKIETTQKQYLTYILSDRAANSTIEVVPERGGIITRWQVGDREILYLDAERFSNRDLSVRGGVPILFPICGNLPDNSYTHNGQQYNLKQHGVARDLPWEVVEQTEDNLASITLTLNSSDRTLEVYPFDFQLAFTYELFGNSLKIKQRYTNRSLETMPFSAGFHPYFAIEDKTQLEFEIPGANYQAKDSKEIFPFSGSFDFDSEEIDVAFNSLDKNSTAFKNNRSGVTVEINYSDPYSTLVFWTVKGKNFICLEPWSAPRNALNTGEKLTYLEPGNSCDWLVEMLVKEF